MKVNPLYKLAELSGNYLRAAKFESDFDSKLAMAFANDLDSILQSDLPEQTTEKRPVKVLRHAPNVFGANVPEHLLGLHQAARNAFDYVQWTEFYEKDSWSKTFLDEFANGEGIGPDGNLLHTSIILGLFFLGPETIYPAHAHPAEEFYIVLSGDPSFKIGLNGEFEPKSSGSIVLHHSDISHSMRSSNIPFFAIFGWRGDISAPSWYRDDMADINEPKKYPTIMKS